VRDRLVNHAVHRVGNVDKGGHGKVWLTL
jgi:hypothetical protein